MRYLYLLHADPSQPPPSPALMEQLHAMARRERQAGRMVFDGALTPPIAGATVTLQDKKIKVLDGPFAESKEAIVGFAIFEFATREEALQSAIDFLEVHNRFGNGSQIRCEMRELFSPPATS